MTTEKALLEKARKLGMDVKDTEKLLEAIEGARKHIASAADELRMQTTVVKERLKWLIDELDELRRELAKATKP